MKLTLIAWALVICLVGGLNGTHGAEPTLNIQLEDEGVLLNWPEDSLRLGYVLESANSLTNRVWNMIPGVVTNSFLWRPDVAVQFFRLHDSVTNTVVYGWVQSGGTVSNTPLPTVTVTLYAAGSNQPSRVDQTVTDPAGRFVLRSPGASTDGVFFVTGGDGVVIFVGLAAPPK